MLFSGFKKRSIHDQSGVIDFRFVASANNSSGECSFGLSGTRNFSFSFVSGKIYDTAGRMVQSYSPNEPVTISGQLGQSTYDYWINDEVIGLGQSIGTGIYSWIFVNPSNSVIDFDGVIKGRLPDYSTNTSGRHYFTDNIITGTIVNNNPALAFRLFNVSVTQPSSPYSIQSFTTGNITGTGYIKLTTDQIGLSDHIVPLRISSNFGDFDLPFLVSGDYSLVPDIYLNVSPDTTNVITEESKNYTVQFSYFPSGAYLGISLEYWSGTTGNIYYYQTTGNTKTGFLTGFITGCGRLEELRTGIITGRDPKTLVIESGVGTGVLVSNRICATGAVSGNYVVPIYGQGDGFIQVNYLASGMSSGYYEGIIPLTGRALTIVGYNFFGTGDFPGVAVGLVPTGTGRVFIYPTGCVTIVQNLSYDADFYSGIISVDKTFSGPLQITYAVNSVGPATGQMISGVVDSRYVFNFEQGQYTYTKFYSGLVYGSFINTGNFNPANCISEDVDYTVTGLMTGYFSLTAILDCSFMTGLPSIPITGTPLFIFDTSGHVMSPHKILLVKPSGGFGSAETSQNLIAGQPIRTRISRLGSTTSGDGYFDNPVGDCLATDTTGRIWKESMPISRATGTFDSPNNAIGKVSTNMYLTGSGDFYSGLQSLEDSGVIHFAISGAGKKKMAFRGLQFAVPDRILNLFLYRNGIFQQSWENIQLDDGYRTYQDELQRNSDDYDVLGLSELTSGYYSLWVTSKPAIPPVVFFGATEFSGCENAQNIKITVYASGMFRNDMCVEMTEYEEVSAHSGVNYDPVYLFYEDYSLNNSGCSPIRGKAQRCPGICFPASSPADDGGWQDEIKAYEFTIPIYDNATYGNNHQFIIRLGNESGCSLAFPDEALVTIVENDNYVFVTGGLDTETGAAPTGSAVCSVEDEILPSGFDPCIINPEQCDPCLLFPSGCDPGPGPTPSGCMKPPYPCCSCNNTQVIQGTCPGYPGIIFSGLVGIPGEECDSIASAGCGPTPGFIFLGQVCANNLSLQTEFSGACLHPTVMAFAADCLGSVEEEECSYPDEVDWSGCTSQGICSGDCTETGCGTIGNFFGCLDYGKKPRKRKRLKGPACAPLLVFLNVAYSPYCGSSSGPCNEWQWRGFTKFPNGLPTGLNCPPPPPDQ